MAINVAINGFGRIGRCTLRAIYELGLQNEFNLPLSHGIDHEYLHISIS